MGYRKTKFYSKKRAAHTHGAKNIHSRKNSSPTYSGTLQASEKGFAFIIPDDKEKFGKDLFVPKKYVNGALDGDKVLFCRKEGTEDEAHVIKIESRGAKTVCGNLFTNRRQAYVAPDNQRLPEIFIPLTLLNGAKNGDKVICEITSYPKGKAPGGKIKEILGESGDLKVEENAIIRSFELEEKFSEEAEKQAGENAKQKINLSGRRDFRDKLIITIDGEDTRDIDDGISLEKSGENFVLGVHIADVSYYVPYRSRLDNEAYMRGTSVYFPDKVLPMLPKSLSNGACSLNEGEERYVMSCMMVFTPDGKRLSYEICESVIKSRHRTSYPEICALLEKDPDICRKYGDLIEVAKDMEKLCLALEKRRDQAGNIDLDVKEAHIYTDGEKIIIPDFKRTISERIIEQFMISANEAVAEFLQTKGAPCLYRIHEKPAPEKAETFFAFLRELGQNVKCDAENTKPADFKKILDITQNKPYYSLVNKVMLRTMQKARYCEKNLKHFGLASECYCHFTSPIRRYPDLFVHRVLKCVLHGEDNVKFFEAAPSAAIDCSARERIADEAERKVDDLYKLAYMSERLGERFEATVSGVTSHGIYCELDNTIEGLVPLECLPEDGYRLYPEKFLLEGAKHRFKLGDKLTVTVADCDLGRMKTIFTLYNGKQ